MIKLTVNDQTFATDVAPDTPLLWVLRDHLGLTGTKFGCGVAACGACTVLLDGAPVRACVLPVSALGEQRVTTIEGLAASDAGTRLQKAWIAHQVPQCGYCQSGMMMSTAALLAANPNPDDAAIAGAITNICRCGTYGRVKRAIKAVAASGETA